MCRLFSELPFALVCLMLWVAMLDLSIMQGLAAFAPSTAA